MDFGQGLSLQQLSKDDLTTVRMVENESKSSMTHQSIDARQKNSISIAKLLKNSFTSEINEKDEEASPPARSVN